MPPLEGRSYLPKDQHPSLYKCLLQLALSILQGEQLRLESGGKEESDMLVNQLMAWAYNLEPFRSHMWDINTNLLEYWKGLEWDLNS
jgi:hypothetical protein